MIGLQVYYVSVFVQFYQIHVLPSIPRGALEECSSKENLFEFKGERWSKERLSREYAKESRYEVSDIYNVFSSGTDGTRTLLRCGVSNSTPSIGPVDSKADCIGEYSSPAKLSRGVSVSFHDHALGHSFRSRSDPVPTTGTVDGDSFSPVSGFDLRSRFGLPVGLDSGPSSGSRCGFSGPGPGHGFDFDFDFDFDFGLTFDPRCGLDSGPRCGLTSSPRGGLTSGHNIGSGSGMNEFLLLLRRPLFMECFMGALP